MGDVRVRRRGAREPRAPTCLVAARCAWSAQEVAAATSDPALAAGHRGRRAGSLLPAPDADVLRRRPGDVRRHRSRAPIWPPRSRCVRRRPELDLLAAARAPVRAAVRRRGDHGGRHRPLVERMIRASPPERVEPGITVGSFGAAGDDIANIQGVPRSSRAGEADTIAGLEFAGRPHTGRSAGGARQRRPRLLLAPSRRPRPTLPAPRTAMTGLRGVPGLERAVHDRGRRSRRTPMPASPGSAGKSADPRRNPRGARSTIRSGPRMPDRIEIDLRARWRRTSRRIARAAWPSRSAGRGGQYDAVLDGLHLRRPEAAWPATAGRSRAATAHGVTTTTVEYLACV